MKEHPILFQAAMVRAILDGSKTQTRRVLKEQPIGDRYFDWTCSQPLGGFGCEIYYANSEERIKCPYGQIGDHLWVRETFQPIFADGITDWADVDYKTGKGYACVYLATDEIVEFENFEGEIKSTCKPSIFMPRWASRIQLEITNIRVERLNDCSEADAMAEGIEKNWIGDLTKGPNGFGGEGWTPDNGWNHYLHSVDGEEAYTAIESYQSLWESINGAGSWAANPWVWVVEFKVVKP